MAQFKEDFDFPIIDLKDGFVSFNDFYQYHSILSASIESDQIFCEQMVLF